MTYVYTVERVDAGVEVRLSRDHSVRCRVWMCEDVASQMLGQLTAQAEQRLRAQLRDEYDTVIARLIFLVRSVMEGKPGGSVALPGDGDPFLPFCN